ncbi:MAG: hypothetical protein GXO35_06595 [Gammaproteobacteria bacterium]|nr:hypothetical protein [Gammaproteobacteria bacterium]
MNTLRLFLAGILLLSSQLAFSQAPKFNLEELHDVAVVISDKSHVLSESTSNRIITELKLKLKSAGLSIKSQPKAANSILVIKISSLKGITSNRIFLQLLLAETISVNRKDNEINSFGFTYIDDMAFKSSHSNKDIYNNIINLMANKFINLYMEQNE